jgi:hypothetical protein
MRPVHGVIDTKGIIYSLSEGEEEDLKLIRSTFNSSAKKTKSVFKDEFNYL